jgi:hypothetical protein
MPKNSVTDPITDQEVTFAHLLLSGAMNDRQAAEAAGLNPTTAAYTKSKPRVREYMDEHRAAVSERLVNQKAEGLRKLNLGRDQILARLWELANLGPGETKGSITGQIKAMAMIATIEGFLPSRINDRRLSSAPGQFASPAVKSQMYVSEWLRKRQDEATEPGESVTAAEAQPTTPPAPEPPPQPANDAPSIDQDHGPTTKGDPFTYPKEVSWAPSAIGPNLDTYTTATSPLRLPFAPWKGRFGRGR